MRRVAQMLGVVLFLGHLASPTGAQPVPTPTPAPRCGGNVACKCGDTLVGSYTMQADLSCGGPGLTLTDGAVLRCARHTITGPGGDNSFFGIYLFQAHGAKVRYCKVTGFRRGVRIDQGSGNLIEGVEAFENGDLVGNRQGGYGIDVGSSTDNLIRNSDVHDNADEGVHIGSGSHRTTLRNTTIRNNFREQLYVFDSAGSVLVGNRLQGSRKTNAAAFFMKQSLGAVVSNLIVKDGNLTVRGGSRGNVLENLQHTNSGIRFEADESGMPSENRILRARVIRAFECLRFRLTDGNTIIDSSFSGCTFGVIGNSTSDDPASMLLVGSTLPSSAPIMLDADATLDIAWHLDVTVKRADGQPVGGAEVTVTDGQGRTVLVTTTGPTGRITTADILARELVGSQGDTSFTPLTVSASKASLGSASQNVAFQGNAAVSLTLH